MAAKADLPASPNPVAIRGHVGMACAPIALADLTTTTLGSQAELVDGAVVQG